LWRDYTALESGLPSDRHPDLTKRHCRARRRQGSASKRRANEARVGKKKRTSDPTKKLAMEKDALPCLNFLTKKAPYKGLCADSAEKHEPASDIDAAAVTV
jgi:hypothetical protein